MDKIGKNKNMEDASTDRVVFSKESKDNSSNGFCCAVDYIFNKLKYIGNNFFQIIMGHHK